MPYDFELGKKLDAGFNDESRMIALLSALKKKYEGKLIEENNNKKKAEEEIK